MEWTKEHEKRMRADMGAPVESGQSPHMASVSYDYADYFYSGCNECGAREGAGEHMSGCLRKSMISEARAFVAAERSTVVRAADASRPAAPTPERAATVIAFLRENFLNDGAEGESVHLACDMLETALASRPGLTEEQASAIWEDEIRKGAKAFRPVDDIAIAALLRASRGETVPGPTSAARDERAAKLGASLADAMIAGNVVPPPVDSAKPESLSRGAARTQVGGADDSMAEGYKHGACVRCLSPKPRAEAPDLCSGCDSNPTPVAP